MLDYKFIKDNLDAVKANIKNRNMTADADEVVRLYNKRTELVTALQELQTKRNENAKSMKGKLPDDERKRLIEEGKALKEKIAASEKELADTEAALEAAGRQIPNMAHPDAPIGKVDSENLEVKKVGTPRKFDFEPKPHWELGDSLGILDPVTAAKVTGDKPLLTSFNIYNLARNNDFDTTKAREELGYTTRPYKETIHDMVTWLIEQGALSDERAEEAPE